jgi:uncharacterized protein YjbI with pentapeptide repeats
VEQLLAEATGTAGVDLRGMDLRQADLSGLDLSGAALDGARLDGAQLGRARLVGASLRGAQLKGAQLAYADLTGAHLEEACLEAAQLEGATLTDARLDLADLSGASLRDAALHGASLAHAHLAHARLDGVRLRGAHLEAATLWGASLRGAELEGAHLTGADLHEANLDGAFFAGSVLTDADLALIRWRGLRAGEEGAAKDAPLAERPEAYRLAADAYRRLRQACTAQGLYDQAGELYRREMRMRQRAHGCEALVALLRAPLLGGVARALVLVTLALALGLSWIWRLLTPLTRPLSASAGPALARARGAVAALARPWRPVARWGWHAALEVLCGHGERVGRVVVAAAVVIVAMAFVYLGLGQLTEPSGQTVRSFWHALYFSACSFSSLGYAAFAPNAHGLAKWLGVAESFVGNFLLALFLVTFTRKLAR